MTTELTFTFTPEQAAAASRALTLATSVLEEEYAARPHATRRMCREYGNTTPEAELAHQRHVATILRVRAEEATGKRVKLEVGPDDEPVPGQDILSDGIASDVVPIRS